MIKELWTLAKMLFQSKPSEIEEAKLMGMNHFPFKGYAYMMWCGKMIYRNDAYDRRLDSYEYEYARFIHIDGVRVDVPRKSDCFDALYNGEAIVIDGEVRAEGV